ncbi:hypothetical protein A3F07_00775 [candidate division WWE3 bacterium RIFCSPHIGHO2_12_FULL_38_15]|uniref:DUF2079 domain-containing protein n=1 Tax=candidate division WWE3 bacterium RIFCSPHIGHO2_02_FULL_38_14 TaxID=1802620 RepID=A0A1F4VBD8_UNCKA|nr:MAG: hypothetical protein A2793_00860 [candidate division WWE3 bacterium RIFCSPHIGHO2_01_FULL_38_45]OGC49108.1 MAG: hypothetical protein A3F07_00775 [candidate division WWE3 bacterium RIFCSPHIGHO2_12_FULL_38_15]OGC53563.1 MAG: hypothetical protein A3B64_04410 [candidate division WWE3 bacterium RIFCSPLOWO2_01_FULL_37_24]OGC54467.1 MAG: hypothetical protein A3D91_01040 [candidate division WWE3 bacterium RIFCSPHIGHO2_02_FULL_38_14]
MLKKIFDNFLLIIIIFFSIGVFLVNLRMNIFRYENFDFGKFDLGNMTQMVWNTLNGRFMYLTDYFGTNLPRWSMSHVDPILVLFVPTFALWQHSLNLVISQLILVIFSSVLIFKITEHKLRSKLAAFFFGLSYLFYPAVGYLTAWTGFHGVTVAIPFFLGAVYVFERMYKSNNYPRRNLVLFWVLLVVTMMGKEQLPLYVALYGIFIVLCRSGIWDFLKEKSKLTELSAIEVLKILLLSKNVKLGLGVFSAGVLWFITAFFVIIPLFAKYRIEGFDKFSKSLGLDTDIVRDVARPNYFISRYEEFGESYTEVFFNLFMDPQKLVRVIFGGDRVDNFRKTFEPLGYLPFANPLFTMLAVPDLLINYSTTAGGIGTSEITNHRISMIIPVLFISTIYAVGFISNYLSVLLVKIKVTRSYLVLVLSLFILSLNVWKTFEYNNPVYLWITQAVQKRISSVAYAKEDMETARSDKVKVGDVLRLSKLENKDRECANKIIKMIPGDSSISGPDYLGAHLAKRETYAIFPALYNEADYVIVDVFSKKILNILDVDLSLVKDVIEELIKSPNYRLMTGCGNLFVFKNVGNYGKEQLLPLQEKFIYPEKFNYEIFLSLHMVDYDYPLILKRGESGDAKFVYIKREDSSIDDYVLFLTLINENTGEIYQVANLPSFAIKQLRDWKEDIYYEETIDITLPGYLDPGSYKVFVGMSNIIRTRSIYLGDIEVL